ncbi:hypothetical protein HYW75_03355 [Candidatus Pacearchaeota archaeon]|nr:hypothetical protein [Candidatus Pacearchaeota archaeon]
MNILTISILPALIGALLWTLLQAIAYRGTKRNPSAIKWLILAVAGLLIGSLTLSISYSFPVLFSFASGYVGADLINSIYIIFNNKFLSSRKLSKRRS